MANFTEEDINIRKQILESHKKLGYFFDGQIINNLIHLFDENNNTNNKITSYIDDERRKNRLNYSNISIVSYVYKNGSNEYDLYLGFYKDNIEFIHLTIHLALNSLNPKDSGMIHVSKNIYYNNTHYLLLSKTKFKKHKYSLITVETPENKPNSLVFSLNHGITTPGIKEEYSHDEEIKKEIDIIITVLNRIFDEDNHEYYIGNSRLVHIHNKTNAVLNNINKHNIYFTRKNKGSRMGPVESKEKALNHKRNRKKSFRAIREERFKKSSKLTRKSNRAQPNRNPYTNTYNLSPNNINELDS